MSAAFWRFVKFPMELWSRKHYFLSIGIGVFWILDVVLCHNAMIQNGFMGLLRFSSANVDGVGNTIINTVTLPTWTTWPLATLVSGVIAAITSLIFIASYSSTTIKRSLQRLTEERIATPSGDGLAAVWHLYHAVHKWSELIAVTTIVTIIFGAAITNYAYTLSGVPAAWGTSMQHLCTFILVFGAEFLRIIYGMLEDAEPVARTVDVNTQSAQRR